MLRSPKHSNIEVVATEEGEEEEEEDTICYSAIGQCNCLFLTFYILYLYIHE
jgi:hypothetical protein